MATETVFVKLLGEGTNVWRPTSATRVEGDKFLLLAPPNYDPEDEAWEFFPGDAVFCERMIINGVVQLVARSKASNS